jgi:hypothetical protein
VRPWRHQSGGIRSSQLVRAEERLREAAPGAFQVVADLILAGHIHQVAVSERREFEISRGGERGVVVSIAPGLGQPRPKQQGEARGLHVYEIGDEDLRVETYVWRDTDWGLTAERVFPRGREPLEKEPIQGG